MAVVDIVMPKMGESIMDGRILKWYKQPGDKIDRDETLFEISTDKVDTEVPAADGGILVELLYNEGDTVNVGDVVARIDTDSAHAQVKTGVTVKAEVKEEVKAEEKAPEPKKEVEQAPVAETKTGSGNGFYSPLVLNIASKEGVTMDELSGIIGTGNGGRVRKQDILAYVEDRKSGKVTQPTAPKATQGGTTTPSTAKAVVVEKKQQEYKAPEIHRSVDLTNLYNVPGVSVVPMDTLQSKMAEHMIMSIQTSPHVAAIAEWSRSNQWLKLDVVQANEKLDKNHAMVEFKAHYHDGTSPQIHHEISHFVKYAEAWYFLDPTIEMQITMKQACICGSGKKFKQCCAQFL